MDMPKLLESIEKMDDYTVVMTLKEPNGSILANLAMDFATIHSANTPRCSTRPGRRSSSTRSRSAPARSHFVAYQKDAVIRFKANTDYWGEKPVVDDLVFAITPDPTARYSKLKEGECHFMIVPAPGRPGRDARRTRR